MADDTRIRKASLMRFNSDMLKGLFPSSTATIIQSILQRIPSELDGAELEFIDITVSGVWKKKEATDKAENKLKEFIE